MRLSTRARYGARAMYDLAVHYGGGFVPLAEIAARQEVSMAYLEQLAAALRKAGLVKSARGAQGGYMLVRPPGEITIGQIFDAVEGPITLLACIVGDVDESAPAGRSGAAGTDACERIEGCAIRLVWGRLNRCMQRALNSITLEDLLREGGGKAAASGPCDVCIPGARGLGEGPGRGAAWKP